jgi:TRAP-type mannitol/chloroaromatic compound transport system substrate-binding protein
VKRRNFLKKTSLAAASGTALAACGGRTGESGPAIHTNQRVMWRLASSFPRSLDTIYGAAEVLSETLSGITDGRFQVRPYPAGELVPGLQVLDAVQQQTVQTGHTASYYFIGKNPALAFDTCMPFGLPVRLQNAWLYHRGGLELMRELFADFNILNFPGGNTGVQMGGWFRREINSVSDISGLKIRIPGLGGRVMDRLGATVQVLAGGEIYQALERGTIDAAEWAGPYDDEKLGFHKVADYYYYPGWWEPGPTLSFYVNRDAWASLPGVYQEAFKAAAAVANQDMVATYDAKNPPAFARLISGGTQLRKFSPQIMDAARKEAFSIMEEEAAADQMYQKVLTAWKAFRSESFDWFGSAERAYMEFTIDPVRP